MQNAKSKKKKKIAILLILTIGILLITSVLCLLLLPKVVAEDGNGNEMTSDQVYELPNQLSFVSDEFLTPQSVNLTATVKPNSATDKTLKWSVQWYTFGNESTQNLDTVTPSGMHMVRVQNQVDWVQGKSIDDYIKLTPTAEGVTVTRLQNFGCSAYITVSSVSNPEITKSCKVELKGTIEHLQMGLYTDNASRFIGYLGHDLVNDAAVHNSVGLEDDIYGDASEQLYQFLYEPKPKNDCTVYDLFVPPPLVSEINGGPGSCIFKLSDSFLENYNKLYGEIWQAVVPLNSSIAEDWVVFKSYYIDGTYMAGYQFGKEFLTWFLTEAELGTPEIINNILLMVKQGYCVFAIATDTYYIGAKEYTLGDYDDFCFGLSKDYTKISVTGIEFGSNEVVLGR